MKIVIFGASGKTGMLLVEQALAQGHQVKAYVRRASSISVKHTNLTVVVGQLRETMTVKNTIVGADVCISTLGGNSLTKHSPNIVRGIDYLVNLMEQEGVKRFIYLSSLGAGESRYFMPRIFRFLLCDLFLRVPLADHNANELRIKDSNLDWTIVRPGGLTDGPLTDISKFGCEKSSFKGGTSISRANVAAFILQQINSTDCIKKSVWLQAKR